MSQTDFFTRNINCTYPLVDSAAAAPYQRFLAAARFIIRPEVTYIPGKHAVQLLAVLKLASNYVVSGRVVIPAGYHFVFSSTAPELATACLIASFSLTPAKYTEVAAVLIPKRDVYGAMANNSYTDAPTYPVAGAEGWVTLGDPTSLPSDTVLLGTPLSIEPTLALPVTEGAGGPGRGVVRLYNKRRTTYSSAEDCEHVKSSVSQSPDEYVLHAAITGPVRFSGGHNVAVTSLVNQGIIVFGGEVDGGELGPPCEQVPLVVNEVKTPKGNFDGALECTEVARRLNAAEGPSVTIRAFDGVQVANYPANNRIVIGITGAGSAACPDFPDATQVEYLPTNDAGVNCGNNNTPPAVPGQPDDRVGYESGASASSIMAYAKVASTHVALPRQIIPNCGSPVKWIYDGNKWNIVEYGCNSPCGTIGPNYTPSGAGAIATTDCFEITNTLDHVRNSDFISSQPFEAWDTHGDCRVIYSLPGALPNDFPLAELRSTNESIAQVRQRYLPLAKQRKYTVQLDAYVEAGELVFVVYDASSRMIYQQVVGLTAGVQSIVLDKFVATTPVCDLVIACRPNASGQGVLRFARVGFIG